MKIHYFLEGDLGYDYRDSWRKYAPDWEIIGWNASNIPDIPELRPFIEKKNWSVISDFVRRWVVSEFGGIYLDFDVELIKSPDELLQYESFVCIEGEPIFPNAAVTGGSAGNLYHDWMIQDFLDVITGRKVYPGRIETACGPQVLKTMVEDIKGSPMDKSDLYEIKQYGSFTTLPKEYFFPFNWNEQFGGITDKTIGIHHWKKSWD